MQTQTHDSPVPAPMEDLAQRAQLELARTFVYQLLRAVKQIGMYRHQENKFADFLGKTHAALSDYTRQYGPLHMRVEMSTFSLFDQPLFSEESPLPYRFFKDGIRTLIFHPSLGVNQLVTFTLIAISDPDRGADELHAQFWQAQMPGFEFVMVEGFRLEELADDEVEVEVDKIVEHLEQRLRTSSTEYLRFARITQADVDTRLTDVEQMRGVVIVQASSADPTLKAKVQRDIDEEEHQRLFPKLISAVFQVVEGGVDDAALLEETFIQLLDAMLLQDDFATINMVVLKLRTLAKKGGSGNTVGQLLASFRTRMGEEQRLQRVAEVLRVNRAKKPADVAQYLTGLSQTVVPALLDVLDTIEVPQNRALLCDVLATYLGFGAQPFVQRLQSDRPALVRDVAGILEKAKHPERMNWFAEVLKTKNPAIKRELLQMFSQSQAPQARPLVLVCLDDENQQVRSTAARLLPDFGRDRAYTDLMKLIRAPSFAARIPVEREAFYTGLASTDQPGAFSYLVEVLQAKGGLFNKQKATEEKRLAVKALADAGTLHTYKLLNEVVADGSQPLDVSSAARQAVFRLKKLLFGATDG